MLGGVFGWEVFDSGWANWLGLLSVGPTRLGDSAVGWTCTGAPATRAEDERMSFTRGMETAAGGRGRGEQ